MPDIVVGRIPVLECLRVGRRSARRLFLLEGGKGLEAIEAAAATVPIEYCRRQELDDRAPGQTHQGVVLEADPIPVARAEDWVKATFADDAIVVVLDGVEDPHNFGAIARTAVACGCDAIVFGKDRSAPLSATSQKSAAGAFEHATLVQATNLVRCVDALKEAGFWIAAMDEDGAEALWDANLCGRIALIVGGEGRGVRPLMRKHADFIVSIPLPGPIHTLNASTSVAVVLAEIVRQRRAGSA